MVTTFAVLTWLSAGAAPEQDPAPKVEGYAKERVREKLDRGLVAVRLDGGGVYLSWRLFARDPAGLAFNVYRKTEVDPRGAKINAEPLRGATSCLDTPPAGAAGLSYALATVLDGREESCPGAPAFAASAGLKNAGCVTLRLQGGHTFQKAGIADLDGDGRLDFVLKQPDDNIDPYVKYWTRSPDTYKLEAYAHDGRFLWRHDLGWAIERGIWYSPYLVYDLDGDGRAEVAVKTGEGDPRDPDGKVTQGPEYLTILDGRTGAPVTRIDWIPRSKFTGESGYNYASRNQLHVAYLDGKTPCLIVHRGTYNVMFATAYEYRGGALRELWRWSNEGAGRQCQGQGAHWMHCADVDGDGRDEVVLGSLVLDDDGTLLWTTGLGHPDHCYAGDIDPELPGLEIYYGIEPGRDRNTMCLVEARTGRIIWGHEGKTAHIHSSGLCGDIDASRPGAECYSGERDFADKRWLRDCKGNVIGTQDLGGLAPRSACFDADAQRELIRGNRVIDFGGAEVAAGIEGRVVAVADILGDWREEIITSVKGELRIYTTAIPAAVRHPCLLDDPLYRSDVAGAAMGYYQVPMTSYDLERRMAR